MNLHLPFYGEFHYIIETIDDVDPVPDWTKLLGNESLSMNSNKSIEYFNNTIHQQLAQVQIEHEILLWKNLLFLCCGDYFMYNTSKRSSSSGHGECFGKCHALITRGHYIRIHRNGSQVRNAKCSCH